MNNTFYDNLMVGIDILIAGALIAIFVTTFAVMGTLNDSVNNQQLARQDISYYREYSAYDGTVVNLSDVVSAILKWDGAPEVRVKINESTGYRWTQVSGDIAGYTNQTCWTASTIQNALQYYSSSTFDASLEMTASGEITIINFVLR